jgi:hypothetical protein
MPVSREDIEAKAMQIVGAVDDTKQAVKDKAIWGAALAGAIVLAAFVVGRRRGSRNKTMVEVYRV